MKRRIMFALAALPAVSCVHVKTDPVEVKPIHIVMDVNIRIDRELDDFFDFQDSASKPATTQPAIVTPAKANGRSS